MPTLLTLTSNRQGLDLLRTKYFFYVLCTHLPELVSLYLIRYHTAFIVSIEVEVSRLKPYLIFFSKAQERHGSAEERVQRLETNLEEKNAEVLRLNQRLKMNEEHNQRLSSTVDKLLSESNDRLQVHLKERMHALDEKNLLTQELEKARKLAEELHQEKSEIIKELSKTRLETENYKRQLLQQEIAFNIQQTEALTRSLSPNNGGDPQQLAAAAAQFSRSASHTSFDAHSLRRKQQQLIDEEQYHRSLAEQEWEKIQHMQQAHVMANAQQAFVDGLVGVDGDDADSLFSTAELLSPTGTGHTDAQTLAMMLQEQLDAINNEIRCVLTSRSSYRRNQTQFVFSFLDLSKKRNNQPKPEPRSSNHVWAAWST